MIWRTNLAVLALGLCLALAPHAVAGPPQIGGIAPFGVQRGTPVEVTISGSALAANPRLITPIPSRVEPLPTARSSAGAWAFRLTVPAEVAVGVYPVRVQTDDGLSNLFLLVVGQLPQVAEKEDNGTFDTAQTLVSIPIVVEGQTAANDVDYFRFAGKKGQVIVLDAQCARIGSGVDPSIRLMLASGTRRFVASADDSPGLLTDARLVVELPEDGDYLIELSDSRYQGGGRPIYRLIVGPVPVADEIYPLGGRLGETVGLELRGGTLGATRIAASTLTATGGADIHWPRINNAMMGAGTGPGAEALREVESLHPLVVGNLPELREDANPSAAPVRATAPIVFNGRIESPGDEDRFVLAVTPGQRLKIEVEASELGSALDGVLRVLGANGAEIASADDTTVEGAGKKGMPAAIVFPDPSLEVTVPGGVSELTLVLRDLEGRGGVGFPYRIVIKPVVPAFELSQVDAQVSIPRGGTAAVGLAVVRKGFDGPIAVTVDKPPAGITVRSASIGPGQLVGALSLSATPGAAFEAVALRLVGRAQGPGGPIEIRAIKHLVMAQQGTLPTNVVPQWGLPIAPALPQPLALEATSEAVEIAHGFAASIPVKASRSKGAEGALAITPLPLPPGLSVAAATIAEKANEGAVPVTTTTDAALGKVTIAFQAKGKVAGAERVLSIPAVTLNIVRPAELALAAPGIEVKSGSAVELKGKLVRKGAFKDPVTIKLNGLPAGLKADPVTVAAGASDFAFKVVADAKAAPASATAQLALAFQVNKKDYPTPTTSVLVRVLPAK